MIFCSNNTNPAKRRYLRSVTGVMLAYMGFVAASRTLVNHHHGQGWHLFLIAALPCLPLLGLAYIVGRYLRDERDDYQRDLVIRGMLWGSAVALSVTVFADFLRSYGWQGELPAFTAFILFWLTVAVVKAASYVTNRVADE